MYAQVLPFVARSNLNLPSEDAVNDSMVSRHKAKCWVLMNVRN